VITSGRIIDGNGGVPIENGVVVIRGDRIEAIGPNGSVAIPQGANEITAAGKTLMPGLVDAHVHLMGGWDGHATDMLGFQRYLNALLYAGVTTVIDLGNVLPYVEQIRQEQRSGRIPGPRIYFAGPLMDGPQPVWPPLSLAVASPSQIAHYVEQLSRGGVDVIKAYAGLSVEMLSTLAEEAETHSLQVFAHMRPGPTFADMVRTGIAASAHVPPTVLSDTVIQYMADNGIACLTTLVQAEFRAVRRLQDPSFLDQPLIRQTTPPWFLEDLQELTERVGGIDNTALARPVEAFETGLQNAKRMFDAGVLLAAGTDAPYPGVFQGEGIHHELELLVEAGLTPLQAITVATKNAAILMGAAGEWGTLAPGHVADILVVDGNPDEDIAATRNIALVIQAGRVVDRASLEFEADNDPGFRPTGTTR
jgi:imidazolonepropionase-like amidohydrolase